MPRYDYRCTSCDHVFEVSRAISEIGEECCAACGAPAKRVFSPTGIVFKGSGFHNTDYRAKPESADKGPTEKPAPCPGKSDSAACSSCPAAE
jgi:putative FmdB family regulatory protein